MNGAERDLTKVSGITNEKHTELKRAGYHNIAHLRKADQEALSNVNGIGQALAARIKADVGFMGEAVPGGLEEGDIGVDLEHDAWVIAVSNPYSQANEVEVDSTKTVAEWPGNESYPDDDPVVDCIFLQALCADVQEGNEINAYTFPVSRVLKADVDINEAKVEANIEKIEGLGPCQYCGSAITSEMDSFIEGADGRRFCDIACYNEELNS